VRKRAKIESLPAMTALPPERPGASQNRHGLARRGSFKHGGFTPEDAGDVRFQIDSRDDLHPGACQSDAHIPHQNGLWRFVYLGERGGYVKRRWGRNREEREAPVRRLQAAADMAAGEAGNLFCGRQIQTGPSVFAPHMRTLCFVASKVSALTARWENISTLNSGLAGRAGNSAAARNRNANASLLMASEAFV